MTTAPSSPDDPDAVESIPSDIAGTEPPPAFVETFADDPDQHAEPVEAPIRRRRPMTPGEKSADSMLMSSAASRRIAREKVADDALAETVRAFMHEESQGYFQVQRVGPGSMPDSELGVLGEVRFVEIVGENSSPAAVVAERYGGGSFLLVPKRSDNTDGEVNPVRLRIGGDPKPISAVGRAWLQKAIQRGRLDEDYVQRADGEQSGAQTFALMLKMMEQQQEQTRIAFEREREERRREDERRERERERERDERRRDEERREKERERERKEQAERDEARRKEDDRRREEARRADEERRKAEMDILRQQLDSQQRLVEAQNEARMRAIEQDAAIRSKRAEAVLKMEMLQAESKMTHGLGLEGIGKLREQMAEVLGKKLASDLGIEDDKDTSIGGAIADAAREAMPDLLRTAGEMLLPKLAGLIPDRPQAPAAPGLPAPAPLRALPNPAARAEPDEPEHDEDDGPAAAAAPQQAPAGAQQAPGIPPAMTREARVRQAQMVAVRAVLGFTRPLGVLALTRPDPEAAWAEPISEDRTLADAYNAMPEAARLALSGPDGWVSFVNLLRNVSPTDADALEDARTSEGGDEWVSAFVAAGPWTDTTDRDLAPVPEQAR